MEGTDNDQESNPRQRGLTATDVAMRTGIPSRTIRRRCARGFYPGAYSTSEGWVIPGASFDDVHGDNPLVTTAELAKAAGVPEKMVTNLADRGILVPVDAKRVNERLKRRRYRKYEALSAIATHQDRRRLRRREAAQEVLRWYFASRQDDGAQWSPLATLETYGTTIQGHRADPHARLVRLTKDREPVEDVLGMLVEGLDLDLHGACVVAWHGTLESPPEVRRLNRGEGVYMSIGRAGELMYPELGVGWYTLGEPEDNTHNACAWIGLGDRGHLLRPWDDLHERLPLVVDGLKRIHPLVRGSAT